MSEMEASLPADCFTVNFVRLAGLTKDKARECEEIVRTVLAARGVAPSQAPSNAPDCGYESCDCRSYCHRAAERERARGAPSDEFKPDWVNYEQGRKDGRAEALKNMPLPRHRFWGAGEPDCPADLKAPNGELHTMRCKVCGDDWRKSRDVCLAARGMDGLKP